MLMAVDDADAMTQMVEVVERYKDQPRYLVFCNRGVRTSLLYEESDVRKTLLRWKSPEVRIEKLPTALHNQMVVNGQTLTAAIESKDYHRWNGRIYAGCCARSTPNLTARRRFYCHEKKWYADRLGAAN